MTIVQIGGRPADTESVITAQPPTGLVGTDHPMLEELIADTPVGSTARLMNGGDTHYALDGPLEILKNIGFEGTGVFPLFSPRSEGGTQATGEMPDVEPYLSGSVLVQTQAGADGLVLGRSAMSTKVKKLGVVFDPSIRFADTGHGVHSLPDVTYLSQPDFGLMHGRVEDVHVFGQDGDHYAYRFLNPLLVDLKHLRAYGGGILEIVGDSAWFNYGNMLIEDCFGKMCVGGSAHGYHVPGPRMNLLTFIRPQCNVGNPPAWFPEIAGPPTAAQYHFNAVDPSDIGTGLVVIAPDFEGSIACPVRFGDSNHFLDPSGFYGADGDSKDFTVMKYPGGGTGFSSKMGRIGKLLGTPAIDVGFGAGTGATASVVGDDWGGTITLNTGTSPAVSTLVTLTWADDEPNRAGMLITPRTAEAADCNAWCNPTGAGASISARVAPAASTSGLKWSYQAIPV